MLGNGIDSMPLRAHVQDFTHCLCLFFVNDQFAFGFFIIEPQAIRRFFPCQVLLFNQNPRFLAVNRALPRGFEFLLGESHLDSLEHTPKRGIVVLLFHA